jgi:hypothetical protein
MDTLGLDVRVLRCLSHEVNAQRDRAQAVYVMENRGSHETPPAGGCWLGSDRLTDITLTLPEDRALIEICLAEVTGAAVPPLRRPWARPGWFDSAETWIHQQLPRLGVAANGPIEQRRTWARSCILRVPTDSGFLYWKHISTRS